jgi:hypothetical protein
VAQFRVEFLLDEASGMYLAELYHPEKPDELVVRTEARYPTQAAAVLGVVQIFKDAILQFPRPGERAKRIPKPRAAKRRSSKPTARKAKKAAKAKKPVKAKKKASRGRKHR